MDAHHFDALTRALRSAASRRTALGGLMAGLLLSHSDAAGKRRRRRSAAQESARDGVTAEKKHKKKHKKPTAPGCTPDCGGKTCGSNGCGGTCGNCGGSQFCQYGQCVASCSRTCSGKACGADGCGGVCGTCGSGESCESGRCVPLSGSCSPACIGGQVCQANGACVCPEATPIFHSGLGLCMECNKDTDCGLGNRFTGYQCRHDLGHTCHCGERSVDCGEGYCSDCCTREDCMLLHNFGDASVICTATGTSRPAHICICPEGMISCSGGTAYCADLIHDPYNCGYCGHVCTGGTHCMDRECRLE